MSGGTFRFDLQLALRQASRLENLAEELESRTIRRMEGVDETLRGDWKGESASRFLRQETETRNQLKKTAADLRATAASVRATAWRIHEMEMENMRIAQSR